MPISSFGKSDIKTSWLCLPVYKTFLKFSLLFVPLSIFEQNPFMFLFFNYYILFYQKTALIESGFLKMGG
jgi:hypothetical protein